MKATKKQIAEVTKIAREMNTNIENALSTLSSCSKSIYDAIGAIGVVESAIRAYSTNFIDTLKLQQKADKMGVYISDIMTPEQEVANWNVKF